MKYFLSIMKYVSLATLMFNTCLIVYYFFFGDLITTITVIIAEFGLFIATYLLNVFSEEAWICCWIGLNNKK